MWKTLLSYVWGTKTELDDSLDDAYEEIKECEPPEPQATKTEEENHDLVDYETINRTGKITNVSEGKYTLDDLYEFETDVSELYVGTKIQYQILRTNGELKIVDVHVLENDWNVVQTGPKKWFNRVLVCSIKERQGRKLLLEPGAIQIDLNYIRTEFIPIVGDWVEIEVKCECDENVIDLAGKIIEITLLRPSRLQVKVGNITHWCPDQACGSINRNIYFNKDSLFCGYYPNKNDKVVVEMIESNQQNHNWRALKVLPNYLHHRNRRSVETDLVEHHESVTITNNVLLMFNKLNQSKLFLIELLTTVDLVLVCVEIPKINSQLNCNVSIDHEEVKGASPLTLRFECTAKILGESRELIIFHFEKFKLARWVRILVEGEESNGVRRHVTKERKEYVIRAKREILRGQNLHPNPRFIPIRIPDFAVPERLLKLVTLNAHLTENLKTEIERLKPSLITNLNYMNFEEKFHTLLHLDECFSLLAMQNYDIARTCFIKSGEFLLLEIENLAERRPSVMPGDRIVASRFSDEKRDFEGVIHKIGRSHVFFKFAQIFHDCYDGADYSVYFIASRSTYKREHFAVNLAVKHLGTDWLFPTKVEEKESQIGFVFDETTDDTQFEPDTNLPLQKLEWYNPGMNFYQKEAVRNILFGICRPLPYIIFGPPGTGKTVTIVETVLQILRLMPHSRILLCAPSNSAADLLALRLIDSGILKPGDLIRLVALNAVPNVPAKLAPFCATASLEKEGTETKLPVVTTNGLVLGYNSSVLGRHRITVSTCSSAGILYSMGFSKGHFSHIIVDEAGQTSEPNLLIPLAFLDISSGQAILAGDPMQLGPVITSKLAGTYGLDESFLERMTSRFPYLRDPEGFPKSSGYDPRLITKLIYNYRSLPDLLKLPNTLFYHDDLKATITEKGSKEGELLEKLADILPRTRRGEVASFVFHGIRGQNLQNEDSPSWFNPNEAAQIFYYVNELYRMGLGAHDIGIITPYKAQCKHMTDLLREAEFDIPKIGTVEEFQGQEFNVILLTTVRSSRKYLATDVQHKMGFMADPRRLNVAITRARALLIIVGNPDLLSHDRSWRSVINYATERGSFIECK